MDYDLACLFVVTPVGRGAMLVKRERQKSGRKFGGAWQPPVSGKPEEVDQGDPWQTIIREALEGKGGAEFLSIIQRTAWRKVQLASIPENRRMAAFMLVMPVEDMHTYLPERGEAETVELFELHQVKAIKPLDKNAHKNGVPDDGNHYMFPDQLVVLESIMGIMKHSLND